MTGTFLGVAVVGYGWMGRLHAQVLEAMTQPVQIGCWTPAR